MLPNFADLLGLGASYYHYRPQLFT